MICMFPTISFFGLTISMPLIIIMAFGGISVGVISVLWIHLNKYRSEQSYNVGRRSYSIMFILFALMNFSAIFADCLFPSYWYLHLNNSSYISVMFNLIDAILSSMVDYSIILCALTDIGLINDQKNEYYYLMSAGSLVIIFGYYLSVVGYWINGFQVLYTNLCALSMMIFMLSSIWFLNKHHSLNKFTYVGTSLGFGIFGLFLLRHTEWFCLNSPWINNIVLWFLCSDLGFISLLMYYNSTIRLRLPQQYMKKKMI